MSTKMINAAFIGPYTLVEYIQETNELEHLIARLENVGRLYASPGGGYLAVPELSRIAAREGWTLEFGQKEYTYK